MVVESYGDVVCLSGSLDSNFWETIDTAISLVLKRHPSGVVIDCSGIDSITEEGAETFYDALEFIADHKKSRIVLAAVPAHVLEVLRQIPEVRSQLPVTDSVEDARRSLDLLQSPDDDEPKKRAAPSRPFNKVVLACLSGDDSDDHLLDTAHELFDTLSAKVVLVYPIVVPRELPIGSPIPHEEEAAEKTLAHARDRMTAVGAPVEIRAERTRDLPILIEELSEELHVDQVLLGVSTQPRHDDLAWKGLLAVIKKVRRPLMLVRPPID